MPTCAKPTARTARGASSPSSSSGSSFALPLSLASGYIGFAQYASYLLPALAQPVATHAVALAVGIVTLAALYQKIPHIARTSIVLGSIAVLTLVAIAASGFFHL